MSVQTPTAPNAEYRLLLGWSGLLLAVSLVGSVLIAPDRGEFLDVVLIGAGILAIISGLTYLFVRTRPLGGRARQGVRYGLFVAAAGLVLFPVAVVLHNLVTALVGGEEPVFFLIAVILAPLALLAGTLGAVISALVNAGRAPAIG